MSHPIELRLLGLPASVPEKLAAVCRTRLFAAVSELIQQARLEQIKLHLVSTNALPAATPGANPGLTAPGGSGADTEEAPVEKRAERYRARTPLYTFPRLVVPERVREDLLTAGAILHVSRRVFDTWGLSEIEPFPRSVLNFHGPSGTGKTMGAHALAHHLGLPILCASYADIESKYLGSGPRNLEALFFAAERDKALLFLDEADSLLSARVADAQSGSEKAVNSLRSQLLICLEKFQGLVVFASNFVESYDKAFKTRVRDVYFSLPDAACRREIWRQHLPERLPLRPGFSLDRLVEATDGLCGRDIKNMVIETALRAASADATVLTEDDFLSAVTRLKQSRSEGRTPPPVPLAPDREAEIAARLREAARQPVS